MKFFKTDDNRIPVEEFLDSLPSKDSQKIVWVLRLADEADWIPLQYFFREGEKEDLWEIRVSAEGKYYWLLGFEKNGTLILTNADFSTKKQKAPKTKIKEAQTRKSGFSETFRFLVKNDLDKYIIKRKRNDAGFAKGFEEGYLHFKIGAILRQVREIAGISQKDLADRMEAGASVISRMENHTEELELSEIEDYFINFRNTIKAEMS